jgi:hypothetical protein
VSPRRHARAVLVLAALAGAGCGVIGGGDTLSDAQQVIADLKIAPAEAKGTDLAIVGAVDHEDRRYRVGEPIVLTAQVDKAASVAVLRVMPNGATTLIFPNRRQAAAQLPANSPLRIPPPGASFEITADKPGVVLFEFIASSRGDSWLFSRKPSGVADLAELGATTRALAKDAAASLKIGSGSETAFSHLTVRAAGP